MELEKNCEESGVRARREGEWEPRDERTGDGVEQRVEGVLMERTWAGIGRWARLPDRIALQCVALARF